MINWTKEELTVSKGWLPCSEQGGPFLSESYHYRYKGVIEKAYGQKGSYIIHFHNTDAITLEYREKPEQGFCFVVKNICIKGLTNRKNISMLQIFEFAEIHLASIIKKAHDELWEGINKGTVKISWS